MTGPIWVVGSGGLLGGTVTHELRRRGCDVRASAVPWADPVAAAAALRADARALVDSAAQGPWQLLWCAGAGVTASNSEVLAEENAVFSAVLAALREATADSAEQGTVLHASSAGAVYAGAAGAPHTEYSPVAPLTSYGWAKLAAERAAGAFSAATGASVISARFANLYGPGQNLGKPQGIVSQLCRGFLLRQPVWIYVPLDTIRDYLFVSDAASMVADTLASSRAMPARHTVKIYGSGRSVTLGAVVGKCSAVFRRRPQVVLATSKRAEAQARDLRLRSVVQPDLDYRQQVPLDTGVAATLEATRRALLG
jgi:UDP-glucose 4-epimerase